MDKQDNGILGYPLDGRAASQERLRSFKNRKADITQHSPSGQIEGSGLVWYHRAMVSVLIATDNQGKLDEYRVLLGSLPLELVAPRQLPVAVHVEEAGVSYSENARLKATSYMHASGMITLADDSGLEVDALGGAPGSRSARYAGPGASDEDRYRLLLSRLEGVPWEKRTARFRCLLVLAAPPDHIHAVEGICEGRVSLAPEGTHGFGYDPVFFVPDYGATMAQLSPEVKNRISHRALAVQAMLPILMRYGSQSPCARQSLVGEAGGD